MIRTQSCLSVLVAVFISVTSSEVINGEVYRGVDTSSINEMHDALDVAVKGLDTIEDGTRRANEDEDILSEIEDHEENEKDEDGHEDHEDHELEQEDEQQDDHEDNHDHDDHDHDDHESRDEYHDYRPWSAVIITSLLINCVSLIGVVVIVAKIASKAMNRQSNLSSNILLSHNIIPSFACGALIATCVFLIIPESLSMIQNFFENLEGTEGHDAHRALEDSHDDHDNDTHDDHHDHEDTDVAVAWRFGVSIIAGFLLPVFSSFVFPHCHEPEHYEVTSEAPKKLDTIEEVTSNALDMKDLSTSPEDKKASTSGDDESPVDEDPEAKSKEINYSLAASVLLGDFFHNFTDGVLLGTAFTLCDRRLAISISAATVYHELAQELADYFLLTEHAHIKPAVALITNFIAGLSILLGAILILAMDMSSNATGCILALGGGVYIYIAGVECWSRASKVHKTTKDKFYSLAGFVAGVIPIGLVLLNHGHCEAH